MIINFCLNSFPQEWVKHVNLAIEKYHPTNSPFYNPYDENAQIYIDQQTLNRNTLMRSPSITSSTSSSSTSSYGSVRSGEECSSLHGKCDRSSCANDLLYWISGVSWSKVEHIRDRESCLKFKVFSTRIYQ